MISSVCLITGFTVSCITLPAGLSYLGVQRDAEYEQDFSLKNSKMAALIKSFLNPLPTKQNETIEQSQNPLETKNYFDGFVVRALTSTTISSLAALAFLKASLSGPILLQLFHLYLGGFIAIPAIVGIVLVVESLALSAIFINNPHQWTQELESFTLMSKAIETGLNCLRNRKSIVTPTPEFVKEMIETGIKSINEQAKKTAENGKNNQSEILLRIAKSLMDNRETTEPSQRKTHSFPIQIEV